MEYTDQLGRKIDLAHRPQRIVSLVPSQTELLFDLGLEEEVVGITKFCVHPNQWFRSKSRVGGTKKLDFKKITALQPDLIIGNKEENQEEQIKELMQHYPVWMSDIGNLSEAIHMIASIGAICDRKERAFALTSNIEKAFHALPACHPPRSAAYLIWQNPYMAAGNDTFIHDMLKRCGLTNVIEDSRYPEINLDKLQGHSPSLILLSSEPFPFGTKHIAPLQEACPTSRILLVDGELFSWYGSRLLHTPAYFETILRI
jgi:ABC-type Fe3+-hydroxamate transport system substrate-binding protein